MPPIVVAMAHEEGRRHSIRRYRGAPRSNSGDQRRQCGLLVWILLLLFVASNLMLPAVNTAMHERIRDLGWDASVSGP